MKKENTVKNVCDFLQQLVEMERDFAKDHEREGKRTAAIRSKERAQAFVQCICLLTDEKYYTTWKGRVDDHMFIKRLNDIKKFTEDNKQ